MEKKPRTVGVIPARGGSKGIPRKNIQELAGRPLISYTIEAALKSKTLNRVIVSTDDIKIAEISRSYGAEVPFLRPVELASDDTPGLLVIQHTIKHIEEVEGNTVDIVVVLQPTSPLRSERHIDMAVEKLLKTGADSVVTVCKVKHHPFWSFVAKGDRLYPFSEKGITVSKRQDLPEIYAVNGAVYAVKRDVLFEQNSVFGRDTRAVVMPNEESVDIDDYFDLFIAEMALKHWKRWFHEKSKNRK
jgi:N-acylneuraminate cytidylyltransferase/CMP-N,N'-diacetyllegionaminic acid synthase